MTRSSSPLAAAAACCLLLAGCQQKMADAAELQAARAERRSSPTAARRGRRCPARSPAAICAPTGTCTPAARGDGRRGGPRSRRRSPAGSGRRAAAWPRRPTPRESDFVDRFPVPDHRARSLEHGHNRYMIYCVVCHDPLGTGHGKIVERGYTRPPSYHIERLRAGAGRPFLRRDHRRLRLDAVLRRADPAARPLGDRRLRPGAAAEPALPGRPAARRHAASDWQTQAAPAEGRRR